MVEQLCYECGRPMQPAKKDLVYDHDLTKITIKNVSCMMCPKGHATIYGLVAIDIDSAVQDFIGELEIAAANKAYREGK